MRCSNCGYVRKPDDLAPDWQCPACQVAYAKVSRIPVGQHPASGASRPSRASKRVGAGMFKLLLIVTLLGGVCYFGYQSFGGKSKAEIVSSIENSLRSDEERQQLIINKKAELKAYEEGLQRIEEEDARLKANVGTCPITGQPNKVEMTKDPRPELRAKIETLKEEIRQLESKS